MKQTISRVAILLVSIAIAGSGGYWLGTRHNSEASGEEAATTPSTEDDKAVAEVVTATLKTATISDTTTAYGTIAAEPGNVKTVSVQFESRVVKIPVTPGAMVEKDADVVQVEASPDALIALQDAKNAVAAARNDLSQAQQRFADHLSTNQELATAKQAIQTAEFKLDSLNKRGVGESHTLKAEAAGVISKIDVQEGQVISAGAALVEIADANRIEAHLGVQPEDAANLKPGQAIKLRGVNAAADESIDGKIILVSQRVDPATRLVNVSVSLPADSHLMLESFITGEIVKSTANALVVPRDAALPDEEGNFTLFTVKDGKAVKHAVKIGLQNAKEVAVTADDLHDGDTVVITGNATLEDGMNVTIKEAVTQPAGEAKDADDAKPAAGPSTTPTTTQSEAKP